MSLEIQLAYDTDCPQIVELIDTILIEYGDRICLDGVDGDLARVESAFRAKAGEFWVAKKEGKVVGTIASYPKGEGVVELKKLYVQKDLRGTDVAQKLMDVFNQWTEKAGMNKIILWTDTRFERAHRFYEKHGYIKSETRHMDDGNVPYSEYKFERQV